LMYRIAFMQRAIYLAQRGNGHVSPNPMVGCVIAKGDRIIGEGWHAAFGGPHAEVVAADSAAEPISGSDVYVTLEPCSHTGKTPPCVDRLIREQVGRVFVGLTDPNPRVNGAGIRKLREAGITVVTGCLEDQCRELNRYFIHHMTTGRPYVILKAAVTLDGFLADTAGSSKWITSAESREKVHRTRASVDAVLVGAGTVRSDNPRLTVRGVPGRDPRPIILTRSGNIDPESHVFREGAILVTPPGAISRAASDTLKQKGVDVLEGESQDLGALLTAFGTMGLASILVEGGAGIFSACIEQGLVDEYQVHAAPILLGSGIPWVHLTRNRTMAGALRLSGRDTIICLRES